MTTKNSSLPENGAFEEKEVKDALGEKQIKRLLAKGKQRGYITYEELNEVLPEDKLASDQIEDIMSMISDMGINVVEDEEAESEETPKAVKADEEESEAPEEAEGGRTDDPVRLYLRDMGGVELLSREGEIDIAKRIEAGREMMIGAICESPLTIRAIVAWGDALSKDQMLLRDIIDIESTYTRDPSDEETAASEDFSEESILVADPLAEESLEEGFGEEEGGSLSVSVMEESLRPQVVQTFEDIAKTYGQLRKFQEKRIKTLQEGKKPSATIEKQYDELRNKLIDLMEGIHLNAYRIEQLVEQMYTLNRRLLGFEGRLLRLAESATVKRESFLKAYYGNELDPEWMTKLSTNGWRRKRLNW